MYVRVHINMHVAEPDIVPVMVLFVKVSIQAVTVQPIMFGMEVLVYVIVHSNTVAAVRVIVRVMVRLVEESTKVATVLPIIVGMVVHVLILTRILVQADTQRRIQG